MGSYFAPVSGTSGVMSLQVKACCRVEVLTVSLTSTSTVPAIWAEVVQVIVFSSTRATLVHSAAVPVGSKVTVIGPGT